MSEEKTTTLATLGVADVPAYLEQVNKLISEIKGNLPKAPNTNENLTGFGKISEIKTVSELLKAASMIMGKKAGYEAAAKKLLPEGYKVPTFKINGNTAAHWMEDIQARIIVVYNKEKLEKLEKIKKTLEENLSAEAKLANDLAKIKALINQTAEETIDDKEE